MIGDPFATNGRCSLRYNIELSSKKRESRTFARSHVLVTVLWTPSSHTIFTKSRQWAKAFILNGARNIVVIWFSVVPANANSSRNNLSVVLPFLNQGCCFKLIVALIAHGLYDHAISFHVIYNSDLWSVNFITVAVCQVLLFDPRSGNGYELHIYRWRLSCIITHIQKSYMKLAVHCWQSFVNVLAGLSKSSFRLWLAW